GAELARSNCALSSSTYLSSPGLGFSTTSPLSSRLHSVECPASSLATSPAAPKTATDWSCGAGGAPARTAVRRAVARLAGRRVVFVLIIFVIARDAGASGAG